MIKDTLVARSSASDLQKIVDDLLHRCGLIHADNARETRSPRLPCGCSTISAQAPDAAGMRAVLRRYP